MVTNREFEPPLEVIGPLTVGVHVAVEVTCTEGSCEMGLVVVTTTALAVAQYCKALWVPLALLAADGNTKSLLVRSRLVTVTISRFAALLLLNFVGEALPPGLKVGVIDTEEISCILRFLDLVIGPILVMDTDGLPPDPELGESRL